MKFALFLLLTASLASALPAKKKSKICDRSLMKIDQGWVPFSFSEPGSNVTYYFPSEQVGTLQITVTDAFCTGDSFDFYINDQFIYSTPSVNYDQCQTYNECPDDCLSDERWSWGTLMMESIPSGRFEMVVREAPLDGGHAFIRVDSVIRQCDVDSPLKYLSSPYVKRESASGLCNDVGGTLAVVTDDNQDEAIRVIQQCDESGNGTPLWVASKRGRECTVVNPDGTTGSLPCDTMLPVLCMACDAYSVDQGEPNGDQDPQNDQDGEVDDDPETTDLGQLKKTKPLIKTVIPLIRQEDPSKRHRIIKMNPN